MSRWNFALVSHCASQSMIVYNFNKVSISVLPLEADSPLIVNPNGPLPFAVAAELLQAIARRGPQVTHFLSVVQSKQLVTSTLLYAPGQLFEYWRRRTFCVSLSANDLILPARAFLQRVYRLHYA